jgi:hypothetical protein
MIADRIIEDCKERYSKPEDVKLCLGLELKAVKEGLECIKKDGRCIGGPPSLQHWVPEEFRGRPNLFDQQELRDAIVILTREIRQLNARSSVKGETKSKAFRWIKNDTLLVSLIDYLVDSDYIGPEHANDKWAITAEMFVKKDERRFTRGELATISSNVRGLHGSARGSVKLVHDLKEIDRELSEKS